MDLWAMFQQTAERYGVMFACVLALLIYTFWRNQQREDKYISVIEVLSENVGEIKTLVKSVDAVSDTVDDINMRMAVMEAKIER